MGPPSYKRYVVDQNVVMRRKNVDGWMGPRAGLDLLPGI
jgi:hypothetical protein